MFVGERLDARLLEQVLRFLRHIGELACHAVVDILYGADGCSACDLAIPQHPLVGFGHVFLGQIRAARQVHRDIGQCRRQPLGGLQVAFARGVHGRAEHLREQIETHRGHVAGLLGAHKAAGTADLKVAHGDAHAASQVRVLVQRRQARLRLLGEVDVFGEHEERVRLG